MSGSSGAIDSRSRAVRFVPALLLAWMTVSIPPAFSGSLEVDAVRNAKALSSPLSVVGVVAKRSAGRGEFALIDRAEFAKCVQVGCASFYLPVKWKGPLPALASTVTVTGTVRDMKEGKFLVADSVEVVPK